MSDAQTRQDFPLRFQELLRRAIGRVRARYEADRRPVPFLVFQHYDLAPEGEAPTYAMIALRCD